ncbi:hypothetical protein ACH0BO_10560 [Brevibacterium luteolum]
MAVIISVLVAASAVVASVPTIHGAASDFGTATAALLWTTRAPGSWSAAH